ncbi:MAG: hypothetical protein OEU36_06535, partial [Gammaproteobacteria bacterium]|nr:hypothetical protein [Gammaproteobacteria bacterium]
SCALCCLGFGALYDGCGSCVGWWQSRLNPYETHQCACFLDAICINYPCNNKNLPRSKSYHI